MNNGEISAADIEQFLKMARKFVVPVIVLFAVIAGLGSSVYQVPADSVGIVLRFGKYVEEVQPGLRFRVPFGIDMVKKLPVERQLKQEFGFGTTGGSNKYQYDSGSFNKEKRMVTGDLNAALVEWVIQYRISEPKNYLFKVRNAEDTLRDISESVMREVVGDRTVDEVLTIGRQDIESQALKKMQKLAGKYEVGISIDQVQLNNVNPPVKVQRSFDEVNQAQQEKETLINEARREYNSSIPLAEGEKDQKIQEAEGYSLQRVNEAEGDVANFNAVLAEYLKAPEVTKLRLYHETMQEVLMNVKSKNIIDSDAKSVLPLLQLNSIRGVK